MELPDKGDGEVGFGCGAVLGFCVAFAATLGLGFGFWMGIWKCLGIAAAVAVVCGAATAIFGDRALLWILETFGWPWP